jgi:type I restriction-modification system DNA methylase subunit
MARAKSSASSAQSTATIGFEAKLWLAADKLRNNMDAAVSSEATSVPQTKAYKHVVLGLIFLKCISDTFEAHHAKRKPDTFRRYLHPGLRADYVFANPHFNDADWFCKDDDVRLRWSGATWTTRQGCPEGECGGVHQFGVPPKGNANFAWVQHFIHILAPDCNTGGRQSLN